MTDFPDVTFWRSLPAADDFLVSPGFAGLALVVAAAVVFGAAVYVSHRLGARLAEQRDQQERHHREHREDEQRAAAIRRCWDRLVWLVENAGAEPTAADADDATLGLGPEMALELLHGLHRDAEELGDDTLSRALSVYLAQYGLVLGWHGGPLPEPAPGGDAPPSAPAKPPTTGDAAAAKTSPTVDPTPSAAADARSRTGKGGPR